MDWNNNQRPGVYSRYDTSSSYTTPRSGKYAAVVAKGAGGETNKLYEFTSMAQVAQVFSADTAETALRGCVEILLQSGASKVYAVAVGSSYAPALALVEEVDGIGAVVCDAPTVDDLKLLRTSVRNSSDALRERIGFGGVENPELSITAANTLNTERVVLCNPGAQPFSGGNRRAAYAAAAVAGKVLARNDCTFNFNGEPLETIQSPAKRSEEQIQTMLAAGITVVEQVGDSMECVRLVTTRTKNGSETDHSFRGINGILCIDEVMASVRASLKSALRGTRLSGKSMESIRSQVVIVLADKEQNGVIESYDAPKVSTDESDPSVCVVELSFRIAHVVSQIHVTAHIQI